MTVLAAVALAASLADCDAAVREAPADYASYDCYRKLAHSRQEWEGAVRRLDTLLARDEGNTLARVVLARIERDRGRPRAEALFRTAADEFGAAALPVGEVFARLDLAFLLRRQGRLDEAAAEVERARKSATAASLPMLLANVLAEEAWLAESRGKYDQAYALFRQVESEVFPEGPWFLQSSVLSGIGSALLSMGRHGESIVYYRRLAEAHRARGDLYAEAGELYNVALLAGTLVRGGSVSVEESDRLRREALDAAMRSGNRGVESAVRQMIGEDPRVDLATRVAETERALALAEEVGDEGKALFSLRELARLRLMQDRGHPEAARRLAVEAVERARSTGDPELLARGLIRRTLIRWALGPREQALEETRETLDAIERIRDLQRDDLVRARLGSEWAYFYYYVSALVVGTAGDDPAAADLEFAFSVMERLRGRVLLDALDAAGATGGIGSRGPLHARRSEVLGEIGREQQRLLDRRLTPEERRAGLARLERLEAQEAALRDEIVHSDPAFAALRRPALPTLADVMPALRPEEALVAFQLFEPDLRDQGGSFVLAVTRAGARAYRLPNERALTERISLYLGLLDRRDGSEVEGSVGLHRDLLGEALAGLPPEVTRLVIVPDKILFRLPFDALRGASDDAPLAARYEISIVPSAALWLRWRQAVDRTDSIPALVLADPAVADGLGPLPHARREARAIVRALDGESVAVVGAAASESYLAAAELRRYGVLHFAAHAVIDDLHPDRSALLLAAGDAGDDGALHVREIVGLDLGGSVVVLAACRSTAGPVLGGEGAMSLARGFFQAGARAVVGSLSALRDDEAASLVSVLYRHLARGVPVGDALAAARRDQLRSGAPAAAWAGWVVMGDAGVVPVPGGARGGWSPSWLLAAAALVLLLGLAVLHLRRRAAREFFPAG